MRGDLEQELWDLAGGVRRYRYRLSAQDEQHVGERRLLELEHVRPLRNRPENPAPPEVLQTVVPADPAKHALADLPVGQLLFGDVLVDDIDDEHHPIIERQTAGHLRQAQPLEQRRERRLRINHGDDLAGRTDQSDGRQTLLHELLERLDAEHTPPPL